MKKIVIILILVLTLFSVEAVFANTEEAYYDSKYISVMNTEIRVEYGTKNKEVFEQYMLEIVKLSEKYNMLTDSFIDHDLIPSSAYYPNVFQINDLVAKDKMGQKIKIHKDLYHFIMKAKKLMTQTDGYFDFTIGKVIDLWKSGVTYAEVHNPFGEHEIPYLVVSKIEEEVQELYLNKVDDPNSKVVLESINDEYFITVNADLKLDFGAYAKGFLTQEIVNLLKSYSVKHIYIWGGASSIYATTKKDGTPYNIGIENPLDEGNVYGTVKFQNASLTTSGDNLQHFTYQGQRYHHLISPFTYYPMSYYHSLSIIGPDAGDLDAMSTALFAMNSTEAIEFIKNNNLEGILFTVEEDLIMHFETSEFFPSFTKANNDNNKVIGTVFIVLFAVLLIGVAVYFLIKKRDLKKMVRDLLLVGILVVLLGAGTGTFYLNQKQHGMVGIYYQEELIATIDFKTSKLEVLKMQEENYPYLVQKGDLKITKITPANHTITLLGDYKKDGIRQELVIEFDFINKRVRIKEEVSPQAICLKQGWTANGARVCLPNHIYVKFISKKKDVT